MILFSNYIDLISNLISIFTPIILLFWFYYSQRNSLSKNYFEEIDGIYAGFTSSLKKPELGTIYAGIVLNIRNTDNKGYFKGDFDYGEIESFVFNNSHGNKLLHDGIYTFLGKMNFNLYRDKNRHPFKPQENRIYYGKLYIVDRLDFSFDKYQIEDYLKAEYDIIHYREMESLKFTLHKIYREDASQLPDSFVLYKSGGFNFEPYRNVKETVFNKRTRVDL